MRVLSIFIILFWFAPRFVYASDVVLNEFQVEPENGQWVELYNTGNDSVNISGWIINDNGGSEQFIIPDNSIIDTNGFAVFESNKFHFNTASEDTVQLLSGTVVIDNFTYEKSPGERYSYGRIEDGTGMWAVFDSPTKSMTNTSVTPVPSATPTLVPTDVPTKTPTPTKIPTALNATKVPTKIPTKVPDPTLTSTPTNFPTELPASSMFEKRDEDDSVSSLIMIDDNRPHNSANDEAKHDDGEVKVLGSSDNYREGWFISMGGVLLIACGILAFYTKRNHGNFT